MKCNFPAICVTGEDKSSQNGLVARRASASLPAEVLLNIVHCVDYNTLVALCCTSHSFFAVVQHNARALAKRHCWTVNVSKNDITLWERLDKLAEWRFHSKKPLTQVYAMKCMSTYVGFHQLEELSCPHDMPIETVLDAAPALRFVGTLRLWSINKITQSAAVPAAAGVEHFVSRFANLRELSLYLPGPFDWGTFLRSDTALKLLVLTLEYYTKPNESDLLRYCLDFTRLPANVGRRVAMSSEIASSEFPVECMRRFAELDRTVPCNATSHAIFNSTLPDEFDAELLRDGQNQPTVTRYTLRGSNTHALVADSMYRSTIIVTNHPSFVVVTNDPSFDPFYY